MYAARGKGYEAKVVGRWLHIGEEKYNSENIPEELMAKEMIITVADHLIPIKL